MSRPTAVDVDDLSAAPAQDLGVNQQVLHLARRPRV
jgi:hypothetical protein